MTHRKYIRHEEDKNLTKLSNKYFLSGIIGAIGLAIAAGGLTGFNESRSFFYSGGTVFVLSSISSIYFLNKFKRK